MVDFESFFTVSANYETKFKEKGSVFIGQIYPVKDEIEAEEILDQVRKKYYDATHHCYAYNFLNGNFKYSDDGEPNGTAGIRILNAIQHFKLFNVLVISIRYFGGTKLGVGPLGKAYYDSAFQTIENSEIVEKIIYKEFSVKFDFSDSGTVHHFLNQFEAKIKENLYSDKAEIIFLLKPKFAKSLSEKIISATNGAVKLTEFATFHII